MQQQIQLFPKKKLYIPNKLTLLNTKQLLRLASKERGTVKKSNIFVIIEIKISSVQ